VDVHTLASIIGPTLGVTVTVAIGAILLTHSNTIRIGQLEKQRTEDHRENSKEHEEIKSLIIAGDDRIIQAIRNSRENP
jgi:hypothetical protein